MIRICLCGYLMLNIHQLYIYTGISGTKYVWMDLFEKRASSNFFVLSTIVLSRGRVAQEQHRVHREATAAFWRLFHHDGKISPAWQRLGGARRTKLQCTLQLSGQIHSPYFISINICTLWCGVMSS
jgi:hypothetical protein